MNTKTTILAGSALALAAALAAAPAVAREPENQRASGAMVINMGDASVSFMSHAEEMTAGCYMEKDIYDKDGKKIGSLPFKICWK